MISPDNDITVPHSADKGDAVPHSGCPPIGGQTMWNRRLTSLFTMGAEDSPG
jgi:hypothetical protein